MTDATSPNTLPSGKTAMELLELYFLDMRSHLLEVAAGLDRIERALQVTGTARNWNTVTALTELTRSPA